ncbi:Sm-like protein LSM7 NDAI_0B04440 [Naumovozyma dairenensis CBS 421]|uniref:Sm domain-containing protein n=1 Tax=Naumovozyma dairenensis (strain ATCC 10597 / BCRC 20456 / CBS 421 / NBRC 0211 / NRRL Y-12639) TaxID=1071378 RepID=G0W6R8_NAUDC|nr:hypothetical protein NDAI_0B04440 [Naumovozyma dairenensis CBS 421]CCD23479.1 hypothetical protein NDAI_0B04440 [Naumovozyma dairenensis CBS 421]
MSETTKAQHQQQQPSQQQQRKKFEGPKRDAIVDLSKYKDSKVRVKLMGGKIVTGILKGYDQLMNLVLDETIDYLKNPDDEIGTASLKNKSRSLGLTVVRGPLLVSLSPIDGSEVIYMQNND